MEAKKGMTTTGTKPVDESTEPTCEAIERFCKYPGEHHHAKYYVRHAAAPNAVSKQVKSLVVITLPKKVLIEEPKVELGFMGGLKTNFANLFKLENEDEFRLNEYKMDIEQLANSKSNLKIPNSSKEHATIVMSNIFRTAQDYVYIYARDLNGAVSTEEYVKGLRNFIRRKNTILKVILDRIPTVKSNAIIAILEFKDKYKDRVQIGYTTTPSIREDGKNIHFAIADDRMYRKEDDIEKYIAKANFNDTKEVESLKGKFNSITPIEINSSFTFAR